MTSTPSRSRPRDAEGTRRALLAAARTLFATNGYESTTVRALAERAGVNQALLFRYFGSKEGLFAAAVRDRANALLDGGPRDELLERLLPAVLTPADEQDAFVAVLRGTGGSGVVAELRAELATAYTDALADLADTPDRADAVVRAELLLAWLLGLTLLRTRPGLDPEAALPHLMRAARALLDD